MNLVEQIVEIGKNVEAEDPIDFGTILVDEDLIWNLIASQVLELYLVNEKDEREMILLASMTKVLVENFVLQYKLKEHGLC